PTPQYQPTPEREGPTIRPRIPDPSGPTGHPRIPDPPGPTVRPRIPDPPGPTILPRIPDSVGIGPSVIGGGYAEQERIRRLGRALLGQPGQPTAGLEGTDPTGGESVRAAQADGEAPGAGSGPEGSPTDRIIKVGNTIWRPGLDELADLVRRD